MSHQFDRTLLAAGRDTRPVWGKVRAGERTGDQTDEGDDEFHVDSKRGPTKVQGPVPTLILSVQVR